MHFGTSPKQGREMEAAVLHRVGILAYSCPKQGQDFQPSTAPLYPNMGQVPPRGFNQMTAYYVYAVIQLLLFDSIAFFSEVMLEIVVLKKKNS